MTAAKIARGTWDYAADKGTEPRIYTLEACECGGNHAAHVGDTVAPIDEAHVVSTVWDMCCPEGTLGLAIWTATSHPSGAQMLLVVADGDAVCLVGRVDGEPQVLEALAGPLYAACLAALTPVPADDPLVRELVSITGGA